MRRRLHTLRVKLTLINVVLLTVALLATAFGSIWGLKTYLIDRIDDDLHSMQTTIENIELTADDLRELTGRGGALHQFEAAKEDSSYQILGALLGPDGEVVPIFGSGSVAEQHAVADAVDNPEALAETGDIVRVSIDGDDFRMAAVELRDGSVVLGAASTETVDDSIRRLIQIELFVGVTLLVLLATISLATARRRLRPLEDMVETASGIAEGDMSRRVSDRGPKSTEVEQLRTALNAMLHQVETAFRTREQTSSQLRNFVADASHELRTPLASIRGYLQLQERGMLDEAEQDRARRRVGEEVHRMSHLVEQLLALARLDQQPEPHVRSVDLAQLARDAAADLRTLQPERDVVLDVPDEAVSVYADEALLGQVVSNLLANVRDHTPVTAGVTIAVEPGGRLTVRDEGPGMTAEDAERVFDRFFRAPNGSSSSSGSGLGLAIVSAAVERHGGSVSVGTAPGAGFAVTVTLLAA